MDLGILCSLFNHLYWRDFLSILGEFIPQMIFLNSIFGYLVFIIIFKWVALDALKDRYKDITGKQGGQERREKGSQAASLPNGRGSAAG